MKQRFGIVIVTHNSQKVIKKCIDSIKLQSYHVDEIVIVDSGSTDLSYLDEIQEHDNVLLVKSDNIGFSRGNNLGVQYLSNKIDLVIFLNPDTFLSPGFCQKAYERFKADKQLSVLSGKLLTYDLQKNCPNGRIDSCGIFRKWYGRWYDRGQGEIDKGQYDKKQYVPALCGALFCCRSHILNRFDGELFDGDFFMYKEDIELSVRLRKHNIQLLYDPALIAYHCRGWNKSRKNILPEIKRLASRNEIILYKKHPSPYILWALLKYFFVVLFRF